jgi:hypothetical protein
MPRVDAIVGRSLNEMRKSTGESQYPERPMAMLDGPTIRGMAWRDFLTLHDVGCVCVVTLLSDSPSD